MGLKVIPLSSSVTSAVSVAVAVRPPEAVWVMVTDSSLPSASSTADSVTSWVVS